MRAVLAAALRRLAHRLEPQAAREERLLNQLVSRLETLQQSQAVIDVDGETLVRAIKRRNHKRGLPPNTI